jgi:hypothetical protein
MTSNTALKTAPPERSPERAALADSIARRDAASLALTAGQAAVERAKDAITAAEAKVDRLRHALAHGTEADADAMADAMASGRAPAPSSAARKARTALEDGEHELAAATSALAKLRANQGRLEDTILHAQNLVVARADVVLRASAGQALAAAETAALQLRELMPVLQYFRDPSITPQDVLSTPRHPPFSLDWNWNVEVRRFGRERARERGYAAGDAVRVRDGAFNAELGPAIKAFVEAPPHLNGWNWHRHPSLEPWHKCREALIAGDPDAPLPALP